MTYLLLTSDCPRPSQLALEHAVILVYDTKTPLELSKSTRRLKAFREEHGRILVRSRTIKVVT
jgi:hypothetical protein